MWDFTKTLQPLIFMGESTSFSKPITLTERWDSHIAGPGFPVGTYKWVQDFDKIHDPLPRDSNARMSWRCYRWVVPFMSRHPAGTYDRHDQSLSSSTHCEEISMFHTVGLVHTLTNPRAVRKKAVNNAWELGSVWYTWDSTHHWARAAKRAWARMKR